MSSIVSSSPLLLVASKFDYIMRGVGTTPTGYISVLAATTVGGVFVVDRVKFFSTVLSTSVVCQLFRNLGQPSHLACCTPLRGRETDRGRPMWKVP